MQATKIAFEKNYSDGSGVEFAVRLEPHVDGQKIEFEATNIVSFPMGELDWLIDALYRIRAETTTPS